MALVASAPGKRISALFSVFTFLSLGQQKQIAPGRDTVEKISVRRVIEEKKKSL